MMLMTITIAVILGWERSADYSLDSQGGTGCAYTEVVAVEPRNTARDTAARV